MAYAGWCHNRARPTTSPGLVDIGLPKAPPDSMSSAPSMRNGSSFLGTLLLSVVLCITGSVSLARLRARAVLEKLLANGVPC